MINTKRKYPQLFPLDIDHDRQDGLGSFVTGVAHIKGIGPLSKKIDNPHQKLPRAATLVSHFLLGADGVC